MRISILCLIFSATFFWSCSSTKNPSTQIFRGDQVDIEADPDKCYAKCWIPDKIETKYEEVVYYTGDEKKENVSLHIIEHEISPASTKWVKKKADRNCISADPNDCLVWCLVEVPAQVEKHKILIDTTESKNFEIRQLEYKAVEKRGYLEWRTVLCEQEVSENIVHQIQDKLRAADYYNKNNSSSLNKSILKALKSFQKDNGLPVGHLDQETLQHLGLLVG